MFCVTVILSIAETVTGGFTRMVKERLFCVGKSRLPAPSRTVTVSVKVPVCVGVPVMRLIHIDRKARTYGRIALWERAARWGNVAPYPIRIGSATT